MSERRIVIIFAIIILILLGIGFGSGFFSGILAVGGFGQEFAGEPLQFGGNNGQSPLVGTTIRLKTRSLDSDQQFCFQRSTAIQFEGSGQLSANQQYILDGTVVETVSGSCGSSSGGFVKCWMEQNIGFEEFDEPYITGLPAPPKSWWLDVCYGVPESKDGFHTLEVKDGSLTLVSIDFYKLPTLCVPKSGFQKNTKEFTAGQTIDLDTFEPFTVETFCHTAPLQIVDLEDRVIGQNTPFLDQLINGGFLTVPSDQVWRIEWISKARGLPFPCDPEEVLNSLGECEARFQNVYFCNGIEVDSPDACITSPDTRWICELGTASDGTGSGDGTRITQCEYCGKGEVPVDAVFNEETDCWTFSPNPVPFCPAGEGNLEVVNGNLVCRELAFTGFMLPFGSLTPMDLLGWILYGIIGLAVIVGIVLGINALLGDN